MGTSAWFGLGVALCLGCGGSSSSAPTGSDGGAGDAPTTEAGAPQVINAPNDTWTWVDFADSRCANGTPTGIGVNPHAGATRMLLYLQGGGACADATTCWGATPTAVNIASGYGARQFAADPSTSVWAFQRAQMGNPFPDYIYVYVPYCTGDVHSGTNVATYMVNGMPQPTYHYGGKNADLFFASLARSYPGLQRVILAGVSAGGVGTVINQDFAVRAFGGVRVDVYDDSGLPIDNSNPVFTSGITNWAPQVPQGCSNCLALSKVFAFDRMTYPSSRFAAVTFQTDSVQPMFYGVSPQAFAMLISTFLQSLASDPNAHYFEALATGHGVSAPGTASIDPAAFQALPGWATKMVTDDPTWANAMY